MQTVALSDAEWAPFWISYKALKKLSLIHI